MERSASQDPKAASLIPPVLLSAPHKTAPSPRQRRALRSRDGCLNCRIRRKKCDYERPSCQACLRLKLLCSWKNASVPDFVPHKPVQDGKQVMVVAVNSSLLNRLDRMVNKSSARLLDGSLANYNFTQSPPPTSLLPPLNVYNIGALNSKSLRDPFSRTLFDHYVHRLSGVMSIGQGTSNPWVTLLLPLALSNETVLESLLALSGVHYATDQTSTVQQASWAHYGHAIRTLKMSLTDYGRMTKKILFQLCLVSIVMLMVEVVSQMVSLSSSTNKSQAQNTKSGGNVLQHLKGSRQLLRLALQHSDHDQDGALGSLVVELYIYIAMVVTVSAASIIENETLEDVATFSPYLPKSAVCGVLRGSAIELFLLIPQVSVLGSYGYRQKRSQMPTSWEMVSTYLNTRSFISRWEPPADAESDAALCGKIYQQALLVFLETTYNKSELRTTRHPCVASAFDALKPLLSSLSVSSPSNTTICWPLVILGICARLPEEQQMIRQRLSNIYETQRLLNVQQAIELLQVVWSKSQYENACPGDLEVIMQEEKMRIFFI